MNVGRGQTFDFKRATVQPLEAQMAYRFGIQPLEAQNDKVC